MKKIKLLLIIITLLTFFPLLHLASNIFFEDSIKIAHIKDVTIYLGDSQSRDLSGSYNTILELILSIFLLFGLLLSFKCIYDIIKSGFFTRNSKKLMYYAGFIFLCLGLISTAYHSIQFFESTENLTQLMIFGAILTDFLLTLIGFMTLIISDMSHIGFEIKSENELTI